MSRRLETLGATKPVTMIVTSIAAARVSSALPLLEDQAASSANPGTSWVASSLVGMCASSWQEIATLDAITRSGIASLTGMSICRAVLICATDRSMLTAVIFCSHLRV